MANEYSVDDLQEFLDHAGDRGLMPLATARALAVAVRNVFGVLSDDEKADVRAIDLNGLVKRFENKRAKDFNPGSLREYGRRVRKAVDLFLQWRESPADFSVRTRTTTPARKTPRNPAQGTSNGLGEDADEQPLAHARTPGGYQSAFPIRPGHVVTITNLPADLTAAEADRLAQFIHLLATG